MGDTVRALLPLLFLALIFVVLVLLPMRSRTRQLQQTRQMQAALTVGTDVMTTSGLHGRIVGLDDDAVELEVAPGVVVRWARAAIAEIKGPQQPAGEPDPSASTNDRSDPA